MRRRMGTRSALILSATLALSIATAWPAGAATRTWRRTGSMATERGYHTAALLLDGRVLVVGGITNNAIQATADIYDPVSGTWRRAGTMGVQRIYHTETVLPDGRVLVAGGDVGWQALASATIFDPASRTWSRTRNMAVRRKLHTATLLLDGRVLVAGGESGPGDSLASAEITCRSLRLMMLKPPRTDPPL